MTDRARRRRVEEMHAEAWRRGGGRLVARAIDLAGDRGRAADLGCGVGQAALHLARSGFEVLAVDCNAGALEVLAAQGVPRVTCRCGDLRRLRLRGGYYDLVHAARSLPFVGARRLPWVIDGIARALRPGGIVACHLFGPSARWRLRPDVAVVTQERAAGLFGKLEILDLVRHEPRATPAGRPDVIFEIIARRPRRAPRGG